MRTKDKRLHILLVAYLFPPHFHVGARRPFYMARNLVDLGYRVSVLTATDPQITLSSWNADLENIEVFRVPIARSPKHYNRLQHFWSRIYWRTANSTYWGRLLRNICFFFLPMDHHLLLDIDTDQWICDISPDIIIASGGPWSIFETARVLKNKIKAPLFLDYRDPWNVYSNDLRIEVLQYMGKWPLGYIKELVNKKREKRIGALAAGVISVSQNTVNNSVIASGCQNSCLVYNGYGSDMLEGSMNTMDNLVLTFTGTVNKEQNMDILIKGIEEFYEQYPAYVNYVQFNLIGVLSSRPSALTCLMNSPVKDQINATPFLAVEECRKVQLGSDVLISLAWRSLNGILGSKIFEYMKAGKPIILVSEHDDGKEKLLLETNTGVICRNSKSIADQVHKFVKTKRETGYIPFEPNERAIGKYAYKEQIKILADFIDPNYDGS